MDPVDAANLNFDETTLTLLNVLIGLIMFGVALDVRVEDFKRIVRDPRGPAIGLVAQFLLFPALTFALVGFLTPAPSVALGMILVAACPGGNFSNFLTVYGRGNGALSVSMTAVSTLLAIVMTPFNLQFWGSRTDGAKDILTEVSLDPMDLMVTIVLILGVPLLLGMLTRSTRPELADRLRTPMRYLSLGLFFSFILFALIGNWSYFLEFIGVFAVVVALQNAAALILGYFTAAAFRVPEYDRRAITIEVGIQNSALALVIVFTFFDGLGGMAVIAAWWGVWHLISGLTLGTFWARRPPVIPHVADAEAAV
ncbi:MAG: bile acid:sodium symporter family protein [Candidatus Nanopelagicales bacterium]